MTNDGEFANKVAHPKSHVAKTYRVTVRPQVNEEQLTRMSTGVVIDGRKTAPAKVRVLQQEQGRVVLEIVLYEGRNRGDPEDVRGPGAGSGPLKEGGHRPGAAGDAPAGQTPGADKRGDPGPFSGGRERKRRRAA